MASLGKTNPESRIEGKMKKNAICMACLWFLATVETRVPIPRQESINRRESR
ncbi:hypothetical protein KKC1_13580 [Calderihabitans maritimus]|uniref:Uncharacterized protein n=1 Tax=Calderihabitans maritimus TaxID=1246530 RepID=A0A1Z5HSE1_9FIRM|nr:hypothetical protein KKC1_13580 [Calderihabitans maritimus]